MQCLKCLLRFIRVVTCRVTITTFISPGWLSALQPEIELLQHLSGCSVDAVFEVSIEIQEGFVRWTYVWRVHRKRNKFSFQHSRAPYSFGNGFLEWYLARVSLYSMIHFFRSFFFVFLSFSWISKVRCFYRAGKSIRYSIKLYIFHSVHVAF